MQPDRYHFASGAAFGGQGCLDFLQFLQFFRTPEVEQGADLVLAPHRRAEEAEMHRLAHHQAELLRRQRGIGAFFHAERRHAQRLDRRLEAGHRRHRRLHRDIVGARGAATDAHALAAPHVAVVGRAACHGQV
ncbi:hypothetical protein D3C72_2085180 [compost metagenome]